MNASYTAKGFAKGRRKNDGEQIKGIRFRFVSDIAVPDYHISQYVAEDVPFDLRMEVAVPTEEYKFEHPKARCTKWYMLDGHWMKRKKLIENLKDIEL